MPTAKDLTSLGLVDVFNTLEKIDRNNYQNLSYNKIIYDSHLRI
jgi:hypothetical protein